MATISGSQNEKVFSLSKWGGLNEHPDGDTRLKMGEASKMVNWKITRDGNLKRRPGTEFIAGLCGDYVVSTSENLTELGHYAKDDLVGIYDTYSTEINPGSITLVNSKGYVERGFLKMKDITVADGVLNYNDNAITVENGIFRIGHGPEQMTAQDLYDLLLSSDDESEFYILYDEKTYKLTNNSARIEGEKYVFSGYLMTAIPDEGSAVPVDGMWAGMAGGHDVFLVACDGKLYSLYDEEDDEFGRSSVNATPITTSNGVSFIPFGGDVYILNGDDYYKYDGTNFTRVEGYVPVIAKEISPDLGGGSESGGLTSSYANLLTNKRKVWLSPDGNTNKTFAMPEKDLKSIISVKYRATGASINKTQDLAAGTITITDTLTKGVDTIEVEYSVHVHSDTGYSSVPDYRAQVTSNLYAELYSGNTDVGLFIYGNGTNRALYTGMDEDGLPRADYFPDQYVVDVGDSNTPITAMIRHYSELVCYKTDSCWALTYGTTTLADGTETIAIYCTPVNRDKGNIAPGQVRLVDNNPVTCSGTELYHWINSSYYTSHLTMDERQARRISDRVQRSVKDLDFKACCMWDDNDNQEFYICGNGLALVWNYAVDAWYRYENFDAVKMCSFHGELYIGTSDGKILKVTDQSMGDEGKTIKAYWESGALDFGAAHMRKYAAMLWLGLKPQEGTYVDVCVETDRKNTFREKVISSTKAKIAGQPFMVKTKLKAKKFVFYRLLLSVEDKQPPVTVTNVEIRVRQTGYTK